MSFSTVLAACALSAVPLAAAITVASTHTGVADNSAATVGLLTNGAAAWPDVAGAHFVNVPEHLVDASYVAPEQRFLAGETIRFDCAETTCDLYVFLYQCGTCAAEKGGLPTFLLANGWEQSRCAPDFVRGAGKVNHRMVAFRKRVPQGTTLVTTLGDVEWAAFAVQSPVVDCSRCTTADQCHAPPRKNFCKWQGGCVTNLCKPVSTGCVHSCPVCAGDDK